MKSQIATSSWVEDLIFQLTREESDNLIFQFGISSWGGIRKLPRAFPEQDDKILLILEYIKQLEKARQDEEVFKDRPRIGFKK